MPSSTLSKVPGLRAAVWQARRFRAGIIEWRMGISTERSHRGGHRQGQFADGMYYQAMDYGALRRFLRPFNLTNDDVVYDIGCGMGRIVCVIAQMHVGKVVGVELDSELAEHARKNANQLRGRRAEIEIRAEDASKTNFSDSTVLFLFNPFGVDTMAAMEQKLREDTEANPRHLRLGYFNPVHERVLQDSGWLRQYARETWPLSNSYGTYWTNR